MAEQTLPGTITAADKIRAVKGKPRSERKVTRGVVALGSMAVLAVYAAGYVQTQSAADHVTAAESRSALSAQPTSLATVGALANAGPIATSAPVTTSTPARVTSINSGVAVGPAVSTKVSAPSATPTVQSQPAVAAQRYRDGQYVAVGTSRHGDIQATVVVQQGKIVSAKITRCLTRYPCSDIAALPGQVLAQQSPDNVDFVSGATDSSNAYLDAVANALAKAS